MVGIEKIEQTFTSLKEAVALLKKELQVSYLDALIETGDNLLAKEVHVEDGLPTAEVKTRLEELYANAQLAGLTTEQRRQVMQLLLLQAYKQEKIQANHQMTPDTIGFLVEYLLEKVLPKKQGLALLDLTVGTGNLLTAILSKLNQNGWPKIQAYGVDNDDTLITLASMATQIEQISVDLFHQDALDGLLLPKVDVVVSDLPVGYYPLDERVTQFKTRAKKGHSYVHHLLIEQAVNQLKPAGFGIFVVPKGLFESPEAKGLLDYIQANAYLQGMLNLPQDLFASKRGQKAILLLQKHGSGAKQAKQILLGDFPSFKHKEQFQAFLGQIDQWERNSLMK
ncbi:class I SAM-dependent methyltransferase [Ligilactobacillus agilis]|uniref:Class I SAM-dependent methyltransferase n=1 Tax=Ligilactobacillus agilis TaxID=1601 RepID=A0A9Q9JAV0_9LACO|nr:class I SAM-dependent methyltransferase [Ligilactobacillus agilis]UXC64463.1 class I SAM-dependent methyltransferase [Ligilactobacillus agilis]UXC66467.1 class I SAM-dependent methyltransferase [Ligilactobacillus agilis]